MNIGSNIKKLRRERDITQEQLAEYLNISVSAISQWESSKTAPDISLLAPLANIFEVSADTILGIDVEVKQKRINEIISKSREYIFNGYKHKEALETLRDGLKEYPNSYSIMSEFMGWIWRGGLPEASEANKEERIGKMNEIIMFGEKILADCTDDQCRHNAIEVLCHIYPQIGEREKAVSLANKMPHGGLSRESLLVGIYEGTEKFEQKRGKLISDISAVLWGLCPWDTLDDGSNPHTPEECIVLYKKMISLLNLIFDDGSYGGSRFFLSNAYYGISENYAVLGEYENSTINLKLAAEQAILCDEETASLLYNEKPDSSLFTVEYSIPPFKGMKSYVRYFRPEKLYANGILKSMADISAFDAIRETKNFIEIEEKLKSSRTGKFVNKERLIKKIKNEH